MRNLNLLLTLRDDLVASASPATEGGHESLDFIPGAMLLGAAAARLYRELSRADAYRLFHSGAVRFGDGLPVGQDGACAYPMPLCWHEKKGEPAIGEGALLAERLRNLQHGRFADGAQPKQLREGHVALDGRVIPVRRSLRMKTALDPEHGRVAEGQLFGYEAIAAGQRFRARIEADEDLPDRLWDRLSRVFASDELLLGRSRSAEYGRVQVAVLAPEAAADPIRGAPAASGQRVTLWCLSDLALADEYGQPTLEPRPERLGLGVGRVDWEKSFLRFRGYAPWNAHRRAYDLERQVIRRGSVIALALEQAPTVAQLGALAAGIGLWREAGLGRFWVDPPLLADAQPAFAQTAEASAARQPVPARPEHPLIRWLEAQRATGSRRQDAERSARDLARELSQRYGLARTYAGLAEGTPVGPSPSQWGSVLSRAKEAGSPEALRLALFEGDDAICKPRGEGWQEQFRDSEGVRSFRDWFRQAFPDDLDAARAFARRALELARREHGRADREERSA